MSGPKPAKRPPYPEEETRARLTSKLDLHFIPRLGPTDDAKATPIRYAMVITLHASKYPDLYERTLAAFPELQAMTPVVTPVQVQT